jgi:hypothetical protein
LVRVGAGEVVSLSAGAPGTAVAANLNVSFLERVSITPRVPQLSAMTRPYRMYTPSAATMSRITCPPPHVKPSIETAFSRVETP